MTCYHPLKGWRALHPNENGKRPLIFNFNHETCLPFSETTVPCGQCIGCRLDRSRIWAARCVNEASLHDRNCFITLTYAPEFLPKDGSLNVEDIQGFFKRLRRRIEPQPLRYFQCGEYGELLSRPHHHAILFGYDFHDKKLFQVRDGVRLYVSKMLSDLWPFGYSTIGDVTFESCAYVARYVTKKITGELAEEHYQGLKPEYITMSRRPGIGREWLEKYLSDVYSEDALIIRDGIKMKPPRYYDSIYDKIDPDAFSLIKRKRLEKLQLIDPEEFSYERLQVKEACKYLSTLKLPRTLEGQ